MTVLLLQEMLVLKLEVVGKVHRAVLSICLSPHGECASQPTDVFVVKRKSVKIFFLKVLQGLVGREAPNLKFLG